ncbi:ATP-binding protein [Streptomyces globisporus]|uniref:ATP-binding protein n=1 Tax=Streptomyces globisporus TaxID=1908 RepID=UPI003807A2CA
MPSTHSAPKELAMEVAADYSELACMRDSIRNWLKSCGAEHGVDEILLVAHEILANAIEHGSDGEDGGIRLSMQWKKLPECRITVHDTGPATETPQAVAAEESAESGRGLSIVEAIAYSWGVTRQRTGHSVWATLRCPSAA